MSRSEVSQERTLELARVLVECRREYANIVKAKWFHFRKHFRKGHKTKKLLQRSQSIAGELSSRYEGIIYQMYRRTALAAVPLTASKWEALQDRVWGLCRDSTRTMTDYAKFSTVLWNICFIQMGQEESMLALKPKFMLRQFVDEMPSSDERGNLRTTAYGQESKMSYTGKELLSSLELSFPILHECVLSHLENLPKLTDGAITEAMVSGFAVPHVEYRRWLFED